MYPCGTTALYVEPLTWKLNCCLNVRSSFRREIGLKEKKHFDDLPVLVSFLEESSHSLSPLRVVGLLLRELTSLSLSLSLSVVKKKGRRFFEGIFEFLKFGIV